jgi:hypothetical protein
MGCVGGYDDERTRYVQIWFVISIEISKFNFSVTPSFEVLVFQTFETFKLGFNYFQFLQACSFLKPLKHSSRISVTFENETPRYFLFNKRSKLGLTHFQELKPQAMKYPRTHFKMLKNTSSSMSYVD